MSLLWRNPLRISLAADRLVLRANRSKTSSIALQPGPDPEWRPAVDALPGVLAGFRNHDVSLVLADQFVRYALIAWNPAVKTEAQWLALARHRLATVHGPAAAEWDVKLTQTAPAGPRLACAVDRALIEALATAFAGTDARLVCVQPFLVAAFNRIRKTIGGGWRATLPALIERESAFLALSHPCTRVVVCAQDDFDPDMHEAFRTQAVDYRELALAGSEA